MTDRGVVKMLLEIKTNRSDQFCMVVIDLEQRELSGANRQLNVIQSKKYCGFYKKYMSCLRFTVKLIIFSWIKFRERRGSVTTKSWLSKAIFWRLNKKKLSALFCFWDKNIFVMMDFTGEAEWHYFQVDQVR